MRFEIEKRIVRNAPVYVVENVHCLGPAALRVHLALRYDIQGHEVEIILAHLDSTHRAVFEKQEAV